MLTALQKIKTILDTVSTSILPVKFQYLESMPSSFPAACLLSLGFTEREVDTVTNEMVENFVIRLIFAKEESESGYEKWVTLADAIAAEFRKDDHQTLTNSAHSFKIIQGVKPEYSMDYSQPVMIFDILVEAKTLKSINT